MPTTPTDPRLPAPGMPALPGTPCGVSNPPLPPYQGGRPTLSRRPGRQPGPAPCDPDRRELGAGRRPKPAFVSHPCAANAFVSQKPGNLRYKRVCASSVERESLAGFAGNPPRGPTGGTLRCPVPAGRPAAAPGRLRRWRPPCPWPSPPLGIPGGGPPARRARRRWPSGGNP